MVLVLIERNSHHNLIGLICLVLCIPGIGKTQLFSPGELANPHAHLEGLSNCLQCHKIGEKLANDKCLTCHNNIKTRINNRTGYHSYTQKHACSECHSDHLGRQYKMIQWDGPRQRFNHELTGYGLRDAHKKVACENCHDKRLLQDHSVRKLLAKHPHKKTFLGTSRLCSQCHFDEHRKQESSSCENCHDESNFKDAKGFNHQTDSDYPLTGKHRKVACKDCHNTLKDVETSPTAYPAPVDMSFLKLKEIPHGSCLNCHKDPHHNSFGKRCTDCHDTSDWLNIKESRRMSLFHDNTRYPLRGAHVGVACKACHGPSPGQKPVYKNMAFERCSDCHIDAHIGQFLTNSTNTQPADCDSCHTIDAFFPTTYEPIRHQDSRYPLKGGHQTIACNQCHQQSIDLRKQIPVRELTNLKRHWRKELYSYAQFDWDDSLEQCETCHQDIHKGQFTHRTNGCVSCHKVTSFSDLVFDHQVESRFPLEGKHGNLSCDACHQAKDRGTNTTSPIQYRPVPMECMDCHLDPHLGQFANASRPDGRKQTHCETCHTSESFEETLFDHNNKNFTSFALLGKHKDVKCTACHFDVQVDNNISVRRYTQLPTTCEGCHADHHKGEFDGFAK